MKDETEIVDGMPVRSERLQFDPSQLVACRSCGRANAPNRSECIYCGAPQPIALDDLSALKIRDAEPWEKAFNIVLSGINEQRYDLKGHPFDADLIQRAVELGSPVPIGRVATSEAAAVLNKRLTDAGLRTVVISDENLNVEIRPVRLRSISTASSGFALTTFNLNERIELPTDSLKLIVIGRLVEERMELSLKKKRGSLKEIEGRNVSKDSGVVDLYFGSDLNGFRVLESGFDFSGLGERKSFLAAENIKAVIEHLRSSAPTAIVSSDYIRKRSVLEKIWPLTMCNDSKGVRRAKFGLTVEKAEVSTNTEQFTKYSRLVRLTI